MRLDEGNGWNERSIAATASSSATGRATQMPPRQFAAGIEAEQPPPAGQPGWFQAETDGIMDRQLMLSPSLGAMARSRARSKRAEPMRRAMMGA
jgi:hypothetical protein